MRQIDPLVDCVFKAILGVPEHDWMLIQFLNAILRLPVPIRSVTIRNPYSDMEFEDDKQTIVDVRAVDQNGRIFQIEIQLKMHAALAERLLYTWATAYRSQIQSGGSFADLRPTYAIWLMRENLTSVKTDAAHLRFEAYDRTQQVALTDQMQIHVLQLAKWRPPAPEVPLDAESGWLYFFKEARNWSELPARLQTPSLEKAMTVLKRFAENEADYHRYQAREHWLLLQATLEDAARNEREARIAAEALAQQAEAARQVAETHAQQADARAQQEAARAQQEAARAQQEAARAERLAARLKALGLEE